MNILPKKNWHVRKKENIARVRRDEAEAAEKEKEIERRAKLAEQEARVAFLRKRARERDGINLEDDVPPSATDSDHGESKTEADIFTSSGNINFFKEAEAGLAKTGTNKEHEDEKKLEKEDYEKKIGLLTYLGQDTLEAQGKTAWFNEREHIISKRRVDASQEDEIGLKSKSKLDPLNDIKKYTNFSTYPKSNNNCIALTPSSESLYKAKSKNLCRKDKKHKKERMKKRKRKRSASTDSEHEPRKKKKKKHSKKKKRKESVDEDDASTAHRDLAKLREERLKREAHERKRAERLLAGKDPDVEEKDTKSTLPFVQKYNSQFNPHLAKQNQELLKVQPALQAGVKYWLN